MADVSCGGSEMDDFAWSNECLWAEVLLLWIRCPVIPPGVEYLRDTLMKKLACHEDGRRAGSADFVGILGKKNDAGR